MDERQVEVFETSSVEMPYKNRNLSFVNVTFSKDFL